MSSRDLLPHYDCTVVGETPANVLSRVTGSRPLPADWWRTLQDSIGCSRPVRRLVLRTAPDTLCVALPSTYLAMVTPELEGLPTSLLQHLRLFVTDRGTLTDALRDVAMPYDSRLDGSRSAYSGTRATFATRAAFHFITEIFAQDPKGTPTEHAQQVLAACSKWRRKKIATGESRSDQQIRTLIERLLREGLSTPTAQLRALRTIKRVACEQSRFARLFREVVNG